MTERRERVKRQVRTHMRRTLTASHVRTLRGGTAPLGFGHPLLPLTQTLPHDGEGLSGQLRCPANSQACWSPRTKNPLLGPLLRRALRRVLLLR